MHGGKVIFGEEKYHSSSSCHFQYFILWGSLKSAKPQRGFIKHLVIHLEKACFPCWIPENVGYGMCFFFLYLSAVMCWCVLTMTLVTDGVTVQMMELKVTIQQIEALVCVCSDKVCWILKNIGKKMFVCVFTRPFPSEDTALNEDDVYRSLEELAE